MESARLANCISETRGISGISGHSTCLPAYSYLGTISALSSLHGRKRTHFQFVGLFLGPRVLTEVLAALLSLLRTCGIQVIGCLEDLLLKDPSPSKLTKNVKTAIQIVQGFSWMINIQPPAHLKYLGLILDSYSRASFKTGRTHCLLSLCFFPVKHGTP